MKKFVTIPKRSKCSSNSSLEQLVVSPALHIRIAFVAGSEITSGISFKIPAKHFDTFLAIFCSFTFMIDLNRLRINRHGVNSEQRVFNHIVTSIGKNIILTFYYSFTSIALVYDS